MKLSYINCVLAALVTTILGSLGPIVGFLVLGGIYYIYAEHRNTIAYKLMIILLFVLTGFPVVVLSGMFYLVGNFCIVIARKIFEPIGTSNPPHPQDNASIVEGSYIIKQ